MEDGHKPGVKDLFATIKKSPALMITAIVGVLLVLYIVIKKGPSAPPATTAPNASNLTGTSGGSYIQPYIEPIVIPQYGNNGGTNASAPGPTTGITMPPASGAGSNPITSGNASGSPGSGPATVNSNTEPYVGPVTGGGTGAPYFGLLGPRVQLLGNNQYQIPGVQGPQPLPLGLQSSNLTPGSQGRVWYKDPTTGQQRLLTSGTGPAVTNSPNGTVTQGTTQTSTGGASNTSTTTTNNNPTNTTNRGTVPSNG